eukprot:3834793-Rhodomonas_salina.1
MPLLPCTAEIVFPLQPYTEPAYAATRWLSPYAVPSTEKAFAGTRRPTICPILRQRIWYQAMWRECLDLKRHVCGDTDRRYLDLDPRP